MTDSLNPRIFSVMNGLMPKEGPVGVRVEFDWNLNAQYAFNLLYLTTQKALTNVQSIWIDNFDNTAEMILSGSALGQRIVIPPQSGGYLPLLVPTPPEISASSVSTAKSSIICLNIPMPAHIFSRSGVVFTFAGGALVTSDVNLLNSLVGNLIGTAAFGRGNGDTNLPLFQGNFPVVFDKATTGSTDVFAASPGNGWFLTGFQLDVSADAAIAVAGNVVVEIREAAAVIWRGRVYLPAASAPAAFIGGVMENPPGFVYNAKALNTACVVNFSVALTAGTIACQFYGGRTTVIL